MIAWLLEKAGDFADLIALGTLISGGGLWVVKMLFAGRKQVKGLFDRVDKLTEAVEGIAGQFKPNGGDSLWDQVQSIRAYQWNFAEVITDKPIWESDPAGGCTKVNTSYAKLAERNTSELVGAGWENFVHPDDRDRVSDEWHDAINKKRIFESSFRVRGRSGATYRVRATAKPIETNTGRVVAFVGRYDDVQPI